MLTEEAGGTTKVRRSDIPVGDYVVLCDARDDVGRLAAVACAEGQEVRDRALTTIDLVLEDAD